jgi:hypothetical protein
MDLETKALIKQCADAAAHQAVEETLIRFGMDPGDPIKSQKNMAAMDEMRQLMEDPDFRANLKWVAEIRESMGLAKKQGLKTAVGLLVTFIVGMIVLGFQTEVKSWFGG